MVVLYVFCKTVSSRFIILKISNNSSWFPTFERSIREAAYLQKTTCSQFGYCFYWRGVTVYSSPRGALGGRGLEVPIRITIGYEQLSKIKRLKNQLKKKKCLFIEEWRSNNRSIYTDLYSPIIYLYTILCYLCKYSNKAL